MLKTEVLIIGGGIAGSYLASLLPERVERVILDQKSDLKKDSCSGIVSKRIEDLIDKRELDKIKERELTGVEINLGGQSINLTNETYVLNRNQLNSLLIEKAEKKGTEVLLEERARGIKPKPNNCSSEPLQIKCDDEEIEAKLLVDCSGANSFVPTQLDLEAKTKEYTSGTVRFKKEEVTTEDVDYSRVFYDESYSSTHFAWILPREGEIEYGVIGRPAGLENFLQDQGLQSPTNKFCFDRLRLGQVETCQDRIMLLGESACQNKPITGGGIIYGMICANYCSQAIQKSLAANNFSQTYLKREYERRWQQEIKRSIELQLEIQSVLERIDFSRTQLPQIELEADYDLLF